MLLKFTKNIFWEKYKIHIFPAILLVLLLLMTGFRISGSSIGVYHDYFYGKGTKDSSLLFGVPQPVRSDEFLVNTQMTISQANSGLSRINPNINEGRDMSVIVDAPYSEWSALFKPQNFSFFVLPLEFAFAFKWWLLIVALSIGAYYFSLKLYPTKIVVAVLSSILISCSPFVFWWYQTGTIATMAYGFLIALIAMSICDNSSLSLLRRKLPRIASTALKTATLSYLLVSFALVLYPPFQIPVALVVTFFTFGYLLNSLKGRPKKKWIITLVPFLVAVVLVAITCATFLLTRSETISTIANTVYPGKREITSGGGYDTKRLLVTYLQPQLERGSRGAKYYENQSESSNFILPSSTLLIPSVAMFTWLLLKKRKTDWLLLSLILCNLLFLAHLFLPLPLWITKLFLLHLVPQQRLIIGLGLLGVMTLIYMMKLASEHIRMTTKFMVAVVSYVTVYFSISFLAGLGTIAQYPEFISSLKLMLTLNFILCFGLLFIFLKKYVIGLSILALFGFMSIVRVNPLYQGLGPINDSSLTKTFQTISPPKSKWGVIGDLYLENLPQMSNRQSVSGVEFYPNLAFWKQYAGKENDFIYNRYAHVLLSEDTNTAKLVQPDLFMASAQCNKKLITSIDYILSTHPIPFLCDKLVTTKAYPNVTLYFYKIDHSKNYN